MSEDSASHLPPAAEPPAPVPPPPVPSPPPLLPDLGEAVYRGGPDDGDHGQESQEGPGSGGEDRPNMG
jgi:hypothetical protein